MRRAAGLGLALALLWPASAVAAAPACAPGTGAQPTFRTDNSRLTATQVISLRWDFGSASITDRSVRVTAPTGVTVRIVDAGLAEIRSPRPGAVPIRLDWDQDVSDSSSAQCSATATTTLSIGPATPLRARFTRDVHSFQPDIGIDLYGPSDRADVSKVEVRVRAVRGASRYPPARARVFSHTFDLQSGRIFNLRTSAKLFVTTESFARSPIARVTVDGFRRLGGNSSHKAGGFDLEVRQSGRRLIRVRAKLYRCRDHDGCLLRGLKVQR